MNELVLDGCRPVPLAHYLKALAVLRLVSEQKDEKARGFWDRDRFVLRTNLSSEELEQFFLEEYRPTPIIAPWNGGSGFYHKDNKVALEAIARSSASRLASYRDAIETASHVLDQLGIKEKVGSNEKAILLEGCRGRLPDDVLPWLDAVFVLTNDGTKYPPLLGTGGNDGRLEFTNNLMQRLVALIDVDSGWPVAGAKGLLRGSLFDAPTNDLVKGAPIGQFLPEHAGGANSGTGFSGDSLINPWDFVLMIEGATAFAAATVRRTEAEAAGALSAPFTVRSVGAAYGSSAATDENSSRAELWLPLWTRATSFPEARALFAEGRARIGGRPVRNGVDFARAIAGLGVDRGISAFERYGFHVRNGLAYFAVPLGRFAVRAQPSAGLLLQVDSWLDNFRRRSTGPNAPASSQRALRNLESSIFALCARGDALRVQGVLTALGQCERVMATSLRWTTENRLRPVPALDPKWLKEADDGSVEYRLAAALASVVGRYGSSDSARYVRIRQQFEPVLTRKGSDGLRVDWEQDAGREVVWTPGQLVGGLNAVMARRLILATQSGTPTYPDMGFPSAALGDIADFIEGRVDDRRLTDLLCALLLLDWSRIEVEHLPRRRGLQRSPFPGAFYALLKLCFAGPEKLPLKQTVDSPEESRKGTMTSNRDWTVPVVPRIHRLAASGQSVAAADEALRRLRGCGFVPALSNCAIDSDTAARTAAALLFPVSHSDRQALSRQLLRLEQQGGEGADDSGNRKTMTSTQGAIA